MRTCYTNPPRLRVASSPSPARHTAPSLSCCPPAPNQVAGELWLFRRLICTAVSALPLLVDTDTLDFLEWKEVWSTTARNWTIPSPPISKVETPNEGSQVRGCFLITSVFEICSRKLFPSMIPTENPHGWECHPPPGFGTPAHMAPPQFQTLKKKHTLLL